MGNPDLAKTCALWRKRWPLIWVFTAFPSLTWEGGMSFGAVKGVYQLEQQVQLLLCHLPPRPLRPAAWHLYLHCGSSAKRKAGREPVKGPTSSHSSPGQSQPRNKWGAPLGESDSETTMAWRLAVTHGTSMGELSVEAENTKVLFFPSFFFFFSFFFALPLAALCNTRAAEKHVFLIIGSNSRLTGLGRQQHGEGTGHEGNCNS